MNSKARSCIDVLLLIGSIILDILLTAFAACLVYLGLVLLNGSLMAILKLTFVSGDSFVVACSGFGIGIIIARVVMVLILVTSIVLRENLFFSIYLLMAGSSSNGTFVERQLIKMGLKPADSYHVGRIFSKINK